MSNQEQKAFKVATVFSKVPNRFLLCVAAAKRAKQIKDGVKPLVELTEEEQVPILTALEEIGQGKLTVVVKDSLSEEKEILEKMDQILDSEISKESEESEKDEKKSAKDLKSKSKAKSLAA